MSRRATLLYDGDCGFCRWSVGRVLRRDTRGCLQTAQIQTPDGARMLASVPAGERLRSWHMVLEDGPVYSGGEVFAPLLELLGRRGQARVLARVPGLTDFSYRLVANRRTTLGPLVSAAAKRRADELIRARAAPGRGPAPVPAPASGVTGTGAPQPGVPEAPVVAGTRAPAALNSEPENDPTTTSTHPVPSEPSRPGAGGPGQAPASDAGTEPPRGWQQRFEESELGRGILSTLIVVTLIAIVAINLPESDLRRQLLRPGQPYLNTLGVDQNWALFAPDPRRVVIDVSASVSYDDGRTAQWSFPQDGALIGTYRDYRWRKWEENLINPANGQALWRSAALWAAGAESRPNHSTTAVALVERYASLAPPGVTPSVGPSQQRVFYVLRLQPGGATQ